MFAVVDAEHQALRFQALARTHGALGFGDELFAPGFFALAGFGIVQKLAAQHRNHPFPPYGVSVVAAAVVLHVDVQLIVGSVQDAADIFFADVF